MRRIDCRLEQTVPIFYPNYKEPQLKRPSSNEDGGNRNEQKSESYEERRNPGRKEPTALPEIKRTNQKWIPKNGTIEEESKPKNSKMKTKPENSKQTDVSAFRKSRPSSYARFRYPSSYHYGASISLARLSSNVPSTFRTRSVYCGMPVRQPRGDAQVPTKRQQRKQKTKRENTGNESDNEEIEGLDSSLTEDVELDRIVLESDRYEPSRTGFGSDRDNRSATDTSVTVIFANNDDRSTSALSSESGTSTSSSSSSDEDDDVDDDEDTGGRQNGMAKRELNSGEQLETNNDEYDDDFEEY